jgi:hypothetical protein
MSKWVLAAALLVGATACNFGNEARSCMTSDQCNSVEHPGGVCETATHLCSFLDPSCADGRRYGGLAGGQSDQCVPGQGQGSDASVDAAIDTPTPIDTPPPIDAQVCFGTGIVAVCLAHAPTAPFTVNSSTNIVTDDTSACTATVSGATTYCVIAATTITINSTLRATGTRPLVLIASDSITVSAPSGVIDVGSHRALNPSVGAGGTSSLCGIQGTAPNSNNGSSGGGAGGSFASQGGVGGAGGGNNGGTLGGTGGTAGAIAIPPDLRGGCRGQDGAGGNTFRGAGGEAGGAVFLIAGNTIEVEGSILATGEGGLPASSNEAGGGGGGSGGMIGFDAPAITGNGLVLANGGGGGGGASTGSSGLAGLEPTSTAAALGGGGGANIGGVGGNGSAVGSSAADSAGNGGNNNVGNGALRGGGGGGGGGAGLIKALSAANFTTSPSVSQ